MEMRAARPASGDAHGESQYPCAFVPLSSHNITCRLPRRASYRNAHTDTCTRKHLSSGVSREWAEKYLYFPLFHLRRPAKLLDFPTRIWCVCGRARDARHKHFLQFINVRVSVAAATVCTHAGATSRAKKGAWPALYVFIFRAFPCVSVRQANQLVFDIFFDENRWHANARRQQKHAGPRASRCSLYRGEWRGATCVADGDTSIVSSIDAGEAMGTRSISEQENHQNIINNVPDSATARREMAGSIRDDRNPEFDAGLRHC